MATPNETERSDEQTRDQEIRKFCELLRLVWAEDPDYTFCELVDMIGFALGLDRDEELYVDDAEALKVIKDLYHNGDDVNIHHCGEDDPSVIIGPFTKEGVV